MNRTQAWVAVGCLVAALPAMSVSAGEERAIRVALVLYEAPSNEDTVADPFVLGTQVTELAQLPAGKTVYLEAWVSTDWSNPLTGAGLDVTYGPSIFSTGNLTHCRPFQRPPCRVQLGDWTTFVNCPFFDHLPDEVCSDTGFPCVVDAQCTKSCVGGGNAGWPCTIRDTVCSSSGHRVYDKR